MSQLLGFLWTMPFSVSVYMVTFSSQGAWTQDQQKSSDGTFRLSSVIVWMCKLFDKVFHNN
jgi:hypothetical protein